MKTLATLCLVLSVVWWVGSFWAKDGRRGPDLNAALWMIAAALFWRT